MNITVFSYAGKMLFGLVAGRDAIPDLQQLTDYIPESLVEFEQSLGLSDQDNAEKSSAARIKKTTKKKRNGKKSAPGATKGRNRKTGTP
jgi:hypothetical protein